MSLAVVQIGLQVALLAASYLLRPKPDDVEGARLADPGISSGSYGDHAIYGYGLTRHGARRFYVKGNKLDEIPNRQKVGGKGIGGGSTSTNYSYLGTWADMITNRPITRVRRVWFNSKLVYDIGGEVVQKNGYDFIVYYGDPDQTPDPTMVADIDGRFGAGSTPAYRGISWIMWLDVPMEDTGNTLPNVEVEYETEDAGAQTFTVTSVALPHDPGGLWYVDWERRRFYVPNNGGVLDSTSYVVVDMDAMTVGDELERNFHIGGVDRDGNVFGYINSGGTNMLLEPNTGATIKSVVTVGSSVTSDIGAGVEIQLNLPLSQERLIVAGSVEEGLFPDDDELINTFYGDSDGVDWGKPFLSFSPYDVADDVVFGTRVVAGVGKGLCWIPASHHVNDEIDIWQVEIKGQLPFDSVGIKFNVEMNLIDTLTTADFDALGGGFVNWGMQAAFDPTDETLITFANMESPARVFVFKWSPTLGIVWKTSIGGIRSGASFLASSQSNLVGQTYTFFHIDAGDVVLTQVNTTNGNLIFQDVNPGAVSNDAIDFAYDDLTRTLYLYDGAPSFAITKVKIGATAASRVDRAKIIENICVRSGLAASQVDVTAVAGDVGGYHLAQARPGSASLVPFLGGYFIDAFMNGGKLTFQDRGGASSGTILEAEFLVRDNGRALNVQIIQQLELAERSRVTGLDIDKDHLPASPTYKRARLPNTSRTINTRQTTTVNLPVSETIDNLRALAVKHNNTQWEERTIYQGLRSLDFIQYNPGEVLTLQRHDGSLVRTRVVAMPFGADDTIDVTLISETLEQYAATIAADGGSYEGQTIAVATSADELMMNTTIWRDVDQTDRTIGRFVWAGAPRRPGVSDWSGSLFRQPADSDFADIGSVFSPMSNGVVTVAPPSDDRHSIIEYGSSFEVAMKLNVDGLATVSAASMLAGSNLAYIKKGDGTGELLGFLQVTDIGNNGFRFTDLLRGRKGTEWAMASVAIGDKVLIIDRNDMESVVMALSEVGVTRDYKLVSSGQYVDEAAPFSKAYLGYDLTPWIPGNIAADKPASDIVFTWKMRPRHSGQWLDGLGDAPLVEDTEEFELDILDGPGGSVVQPVTGLATPTYTYDSADIATDFPGGLNSGDTVYVNVYQISAQVGRGFANEFGIEIT